jgi:hypothetical protein
MTLQLKQYNILETIGMLIFKQVLCTRCENLAYLDIDVFNVLKHTYLMPK